jgi:hypothetical protein
MVGLRHERGRPLAERCPPDLGREGWQPEPVQDVHLLFLNRPPDDVPPDDGGATWNGRSPATVRTERTTRCARLTVAAHPGR